MSRDLFIEAPRGQVKFGGGGYGFGVGENQAAIDDWLKSREIVPLSHFEYEDPEDLSEWIENMEAIGRDTSVDRARLESLKTRPSWFSPTEALVTVRYLIENLSDVPLDIDTEEIEVDLDCYLELLEDLESRQLEFRFR